MNVRVWPEGVKCMVVAQHGPAQVTFTPKIVQSSTLEFTAEFRCDGTQDLRDIEQHMKLAFAKALTLYEERMRQQLEDDDPTTTLTPWTAHRKMPLTDLETR